MPKIEEEKIIEEADEDDAEKQNQNEEGGKKKKKKRKNKNKDKGTDEDPATMSKQVNNEVQEELGALLSEMNLGGSAMGGGKGKK